LTIPRIYSPHTLENQKYCNLGKDNLKYLKQVMRLKTGDKITVFDGFGHEFAALIDDFSAEDVRVELVEEKVTPERKIKITLGQAIPKAGKMDIIVKSAAELGADVIVPFDAARSVAKIAAEKNPLKAARWQKIAQEAARCCHSSRITEVSKVSSFTDMLAMAGDDALKIIFWEEESQKTIKDVLMDKTFDAAKNFFIIVGPEGGFSKNEVIMALNKGFISVSLGKQILKVETAAAAIISIIQYEKGIFSSRSKEAIK
jgi:16S rRNA (uracil1498-N3)-methyltransferase